MTETEMAQEMRTYGRIRSDAEVKIERAQQAQRRVGQMLLTHEDGKVLMDLLEETYYRGNMRGEDPHETYFKLGQRDVVEFLLSLRDKAKEP